MDSPQGQTSAPAVPPVGNVSPPERGRSMVSARSVGIVALVLAIFAFFGVRAAVDREPPTAEELASAFTLPGYGFGELPPESMEPLRTAFATQNESVVSSFEARQVTRQGTPAAVVFILSVDPDKLTEEFKDDYVSDFQRTSQAIVEDVDIADTGGYIAAAPLGTVVFFFDDDGFVFNIVGPDRPTIEEIARALEIGNS